MKTDKSIRSGKVPSLRSADLAALDRTVTPALEQRPEIAVPGDFSSRLMERLAEEQRGRTHRARRSASVGQIAGYTSAGATALALLALAVANPAALEAGKTVAFAVEMVLVAELLGVGLWLGTRRDA